MLGYYKSGADSETTVADNREAFTRMRLLPRMLVDVSNLDTTVYIQGEGCYYGEVSKRGRCGRADYLQFLKLKVS